MEFLDRIPRAAYWGYGAALAVTVGVIVLRQVATWLRYRNAGRLAAEPRCGRCGYIIRAGSSVVCPECGGDVREVGIVAPGTPPDARPAAWYALVLLLALPAAVALGPRVAERQPFGWEYEAGWQHDLDTGVRLFGVDPHRFRVLARGRGRYWGRRPELVMAYDAWPLSRCVIREEHSFRKAIRPSDLTYEKMDYVAHRPFRVCFDLPVAEEWVALAVPDVSPEARAPIASWMEATVQAAARGDAPPAGVRGVAPGMRSWARYRVRDEAQVAVSAACFVPPAGASVWAIRRLSARHRRLARAGWKRAAGEIGLVEPGAAA